MGLTVPSLLGTARRRCPKAGTSPPPSRQAHLAYPSPLPVIMERTQREWGGRRFAPANDGSSHAFRPEGPPQWRLRSRKRGAVVLVSPSLLRRDEGVIMMTAGSMAGDKASAATDGGGTLITEELSRHPARGTQGASAVY